MPFMEPFKDHVNAILQSAPINQQNAIQYITMDERYKMVIGMAWSDMLTEAMLYDAKGEKYVWQNLLFSALSKVLAEAFGEGDPVSYFQFHKLWKGVHSIQ